jgi:putative flippase GtrA
MHPAFAILNRIIGKRTNMLLKLFSFLFIGGLGALVNVLCFTLAYRALLPSVSTPVAYLWAFFLATEISILANFTLNDLITFRHLRVAHNSWSTRCTRFHATSIGGTLLTLAISFSLLHFVHIQAMFAQAIALMVATAFNFVGHHVFTYRHVRKEITVANGGLDIARVLEESSVVKTDV